jgi:hypothetical protein
MGAKESFIQALKSEGAELLKEKLAPTLEKLHTQLQNIQNGLEKRPESAEQFLPGLEQIKKGLQKASQIEGMGRAVKPLIGHVDETITAISAMDWPKALQEVKEANRFVSRLLQEAKSK